MHVLKWVKNSINDVSKSSVRKLYGISMDRTTKEANCEAGKYLIPLSIDCIIHSERREKKRKERRNDSCSVFILLPA